MATMTDRGVVVTGGVDTHRDVHTAAVLDPVGTVLATATFPATGQGYQELAEWMSGHGVVARVGVEGTGSWGAGLARYLAGVGVEVNEVVRPNRQHRRRHGKTDMVDAIGAAKAVLSGDAGGLPRGGTGPVESLRVLRIARNSAVKARTAAVNQIKAILVTAPDELRAALPPTTSTPQLAAVLSSYRPGDPIDPYQATKLSLRTLARRWKTLNDEARELKGHISRIVKQAAPALMAVKGIGPLVAADLLIAAGSNPERLTKRGSMAALCGASPVDASSGLQLRHRLNRGGDRQANAALYRAVIVRLRYDPATIEYMNRRLAENKRKKEIIRCLKYSLARRVQRVLTRPPNPD